MRTVSATLQQERQWQGGADDAPGKIAAHRPLPSVRSLSDDVAQQRDPCSVNTPQKILLINRAL